MDNMRSQYRALHYSVSRGNKIKTNNPYWIIIVLILLQFVFVLQSVLKINISINIS